LVSRLDRFTVLPYWSFFAPNPGYTGTHLIYRDGDESNWTGWMDIPLPESSTWRWLWNPGRFERKAVQDLFGGLARSARDVQEPIALELTSCHLGFLTWVDAQPRLLSQSIFRQFAVVETQGHGRGRSTRPIFVSRAYRLDKC
jgi:hypothetical protein